MEATQYTQDHLIHFYHLHALDWVDVVSALSADPKATSDLAQSISSYPKSSPGYYSDLKKTLKTFVDSGQLGIFSNAYWGHSAYKLPPEANLMAVGHYLDALEFQKEIIKIHTIFGGKNPHPNYLVGGMASSIDLNSDMAINIERLTMIKKIIDDTNTFIDQVYIPDLLAIASFYKDWGAIGGGLGNFMSYGDFPMAGITDHEDYLWQSGAILNKNINEVLDVDPRDVMQITEDVSHAWFDYADASGQPLHPSRGETKVNYTGPEPPYETLDTNEAYSFLKAPRWRGHAMEVGPLARTLIAYAKGDPQVVSLVDTVLSKLDVPVTALFSTLGRTAARGIEAKVTAGYMTKFYDQLIANIKGGDTRMHDGTFFDPETWPKEASGFGATEAPRGALGHWINIKDKKIDSYQIVVPSTWNASPRDAENQAGAYESALAGTPMADPKQPLEILRTIHSFDPCLACATHLYDEDGEELVSVKIQ
jgi:hydrogenase large subunit